jgi:DnaJ-class molecular chaperone
MSNKDYYKILDLDKKCSEDDIKKSYKKLALLYHPDKNQGNEDFTNKFKEISEAYSILSNKDKRAQYDVMGNIVENDLFENMEDPFSVFNNIFKQHISSFMNMKYDNNVNIENIFNNIPGFSENSIPFKNIHVSFQTFPVDINDSINNYEDSYEDEYNDSNSNNYKSPFHSVINNLFDNYQNSNLNNSNFKNIQKTNIKANTKTKTKTKIINKKPDDIIYSVKVSLADIYNKKMKKVTVNRIRKKNNKYIEKSKTFEIPIYGKEILLEGCGNELKDYLEKGDIIINIFNKKDDNFKRVNEYDIFTTKDIYVNQLYNELFYEIVLPNKAIIKIHSDKLVDENGILNQWCRIKNKGLPYNENIENVENVENVEKELYGDLYIMYKIIFPNNLDGLKKIEINEKDYKFTDKENKNISNLDESIATKEKIILFEAEFCLYDDIFGSNE